MSPTLQFRVGSIWSLWMLDTHARAFACAISQLSDSKWICSGDQPPSAGEASSIRLALDALRDALVACNMLRPLREIARVESGLDGIGPDDTPLSADTIAQHLKMLENRIVDDLDYEKFLHIDPNDADLYGLKAPFGPLVEKKFPAAIEDIEEAANCIAVGQSTASVFHVMRAMEVAVKRMGKKTGTAILEKEWGKILSDIGAYVTALPKTTPREKKRRAEWSAAHANLYHVKQAWRNETMHPKKTYTREQAREVFASTKFFLNHLAGLV